MSASQVAQRAAFLVTPHMGGTFSVFIALRAALAGLGVELEWVGFSSDPEKVRAQFPAEFSVGRMVDAANLSPDQLGARLLEETIAGNYQYVFINVLTSTPEMSIAAYLPADIKRIMIVHNITPGTYSAVKAIAPFCHAVVGVSPRIQRDLTGKFGLPKAALSCVPNAIDLRPYQYLARSPRTDVLRLLFLGRVVDADKGVFWLPKILSKLSDIPVHLSVAGDGADMAELKRLAEPLASRVTFLGRVAHTSVPQLFADHDVFIMTSRFEGLPYTLIEAMAAGCVPVASSIGGITDFVIQPGKNGLLFPIGDTTAAAKCIRQLAADPASLNAQSQAAMSSVQTSFSIHSFTEGYRRVLESLPGLPPPALSRAKQPYAPIPIGGGWRKFIPLSLKNKLRNYLNR